MYTPQRPRLCCTCALCTLGRMVVYRCGGFTFFFVPHAALVGRLGSTVPTPTLCPAAQACPPGHFTSAARTPSTTATPQAHCHCPHCLPGFVLPRIGSAWIVPAAIHGGSSGSVPALIQHWFLVACSQTPLPSYTVFKQHFPAFAQVHQGSFRTCPRTRTHAHTTPPLRFPTPAPSRLRTGSFLHTPPSCSPTPSLSPYAAHSCLRLPWAANCWVHYMVWPDWCAIRTVSPLSPSVWTRTILPPVPPVAGLDIHSTVYQVTAIGWYSIYTPLCPLPTHTTPHPRTLPCHSLPFWVDPTTWHLPSPHIARLQFCLCNSTFYYLSPFSDWV